MSPITTFVPALIVTPRPQILQLCPQRLQHRCRPTTHTRPVKPVYPHHVPPRAVSTSAATIIREGTLIEVLSSTRRRIARAIRPDGKRNWLVQDATDQTSSVTPKQITFVIGHPADSPDLNLDLTTLRQLAEAKSAEFSDLLETAWEIIRSGEGIDGSVTTSIPHISRTIMDEDSPLALLAAHMLLTNESVFFKSKIVKGVPLYDARTQAQVVEARLMQQANQLRAQQHLQKQAQLKHAYDTHDLPAFRQAFGLGIEDFLQCLEQMALQLDTHSASDVRNPATASNSVFQSFSDMHKATIKKVFDALALPISTLSALALLTNLGIFSRYENLALRNADIATWADVNPDVHNLISRLLTDIPADRDADIRVDLTHLTSYAIDSADTSEVDDAFSFDESTATIYVHIADPSRYFPDGMNNALIQHVLARTATLYLPYTKFTMFPEEIAHRLLSLDGDLSDGCALSFAFCLAADGSLLDESVQMLLTTVSKPVRFTYEQADCYVKDAAQGPAIMQSIFALMAKRRYWREMEGGAIIINNPISHVRVHGVDSDTPEISVDLIRTDRAGWIMVSELMITACAVCASLAVRHGVVMPFRGQAPFHYPEDDVLESVPDGPARAALAFRQACPSIVSTSVCEHTSLGLDAYAQVTSPIRRSLDLLAHMQMKAWLRGSTEGEDRLSVQAMEAEIGRFQTVGRVLRHVEVRTNRYWILELLNRAEKDALFDGVVVRSINEEEGLVHFDEFGFTFLVRFMAQGLKVGDRVLVEILEVDVPASTIRASARRKDLGRLEKATLKSELADFDEIGSEVSEVSEGSEVSEVSEIGENGGL